MAADVISQQVRRDRARNFRQQIWTRHLITVHLLWSHLLFICYSVCWDYQRKSLAIQTCRCENCSSALWVTLPMMPHLCLRYQSLKQDKTPARIILSSYAF